MRITVEKFYNYNILIEIASYYSVIGFDVHKDSFKKVDWTFSIAYDGNNMEGSIIDIEHSYL